MSRLVIHYNVLETVSKGASNLAQKAQDYADALSRNISNDFTNVEGGGSAYLTSASYLVNQKITALQKKAEAFEAYANKVTHFAQTAKRVDGNVKDAISTAQNKFIENNKLKEPDWKDTIINWFIDLKNKVPLFSAICNIIDSIGDKVSSFMDNIRYWYNCEGGKQIIKIGLAVAGAIVAVLVAVAAIASLVALIPVIATASIATVIFTVAGAIGGVIGVVNAVTNVVTSHMAYDRFENGDYAWS